MQRKTSTKIHEADFNHGIHRNKGETVLEVTHRVKLRALERMAVDRLQTLISEVLKLLGEYENELPQCEAAKSIERVISERLSDNRMILLLLDKKGGKRRRPSPELLDRLRQVVAG